MTTQEEIDSMDNYITTTQEMGRNLLADTLKGVQDLQDTGEKLFENIAKIAANEEDRMILFDYLFNSERSGENSEYNQMITKQVMGILDRFCEPKKMP